MDRKTIVKNKKKPTKSKQLISIDEFLVMNSMRVEQQAGFRAYISSQGLKKYQSESDWKLLLKQYLNRKL